MPQQLDLFGRAPEIPPLLPLSAMPSARGQVIVATGAREVESRLFAWLHERLAEAEKNPALFGRPIRIVVPSRSLRLHLAAEIPRRRGRSAAGVVVQTLFGAALEILERSGDRVPVAGGALFEILARRAARNEPTLASGLGDFSDGYAAAVGSMRDLLDAGLEPSLADAVLEVLANDGPLVAPRVAVERARSLVRAASAATGWIEALGAARPTDLLRRAAQRLAFESSDELWPCRAMAIHGFAEATGVASDFLEVLVAQRGAIAFVDQPPILEQGGDLRGELGRERAFAARLTARLAGPFAVEEHPAGGAPPQVDSFAAAGTDGEIREVLLRVRALLDSGARPEGIAVVARDLEPYRLALRRHAERLAIPVSGLGVRGALTPAGARIEAFLDLLEQRDALPTSRWLDALASVRVTSGRMPRPGFDFRLALAALGAGRLRDAAELELDDRRLRDGRYPLPIRHGLFTADEAPEEGGDEGESGSEAEAKSMGAAGRSTSRVPRRTVSGLALAALLASARRVRRGFESWPERATVREHLQLLLFFVREELGWPGESGDGALARELGRAVQALADLGEELPAELVLERDEIAPLARRALLDFGRTALGGAGGGIQVLGVVEARARTFEHLFLVGLNRDAFPRPIREDALLSDALRRTLATLLPDVPRKRAGFDEERYLFAQILSASPTITLSWQSTDDEGRVRPASPLVERFRLGGGSVPRAPGVWGAAAGAGAGSTRGAALVRPAWERAVATALNASRERYGVALEWALAEAAQDLPAGRDRGGAMRAVAQARIAALDEHDPDFSTRAGRARARSMGPYFGFVGARTAVDPDLPITHLERLAGCPWQYFLGRVLRLEPTPDPLQALPGIDARWIGNLVHAVLDRVNRTPAPSETPEALGSARAARTTVDLAALFAQFAQGWQPPPAPEWPSESELEAVLAEESVEMVREEGLPLVGLGRALAERARPYLEIAHSVIEENRREGFTFAASEAQGVVGVAGVVGAEGAIDGGARLTFRADRVDRNAEGTWVLTDWKTGKPLSEKKKPETRRADQLTRARQGTLLQAAVYARAAGLGRYVYVRPEAEFREFEVRADDAEHAAALATVATAGFGARDRGSFFPRLVDAQGDKEPNRCRYCDVAEACLRGDSGARRRLFEWARRGEGDGQPERAALAVWRLGQ